jgi:hypothetical protein
VPFLCAQFCKFFWRKIGILKKFEAFVFSGLRERAAHVSEVIGGYGGDPYLWEVWVEVHGRLVASTDSSLWSKRNAILDEAAFGVSEGTLVDEHVHSWADMTCLTYEETGPTQRGREVSVGYIVVFGRLTA